MDIKQKMREILEAESKAVAQIPVTDAYEQAVNLIVERVHHGGGKLVTSGMGKCGQIADNIATTFSSTGIPAVFLHPSEAQHGDLGVLQHGDVILLLSNSGRTSEIVALVDLAKELYPELKFIVCPLGLTPTTSTTMMTVIGDVLVVNTMLATGFSREEYGKRHHGGYLGQLSRHTQK